MVGFIVGAPAGERLRGWGKGCMVSRSLLRPEVVRGWGMLSAGERDRRANPRIF